MKAPTLKDKMAYYAKVRAANYADSLRLEGFVAPQKQDHKHRRAGVAGKKQSRSPM
ncbi:YhfG family protein [Luteibacter sp.]|jgi:hypothetical protein|uniref:YhfG family protein n=1 Tax=Luteibacter sp. TaxID=1886636 RepID=UPI0039C91169